MRAVLLLTLILCGCASVPQPRLEPGLLRYNLAPRSAADEHASRLPYAMRFVVGDTGSMEPHLTAGDYAVADFSVEYEDLKPYDVILYDPVWNPYTDRLICHFTYERRGTSWVMVSTGPRINFETGKNMVTKEHYRAKVIAVYRLKLP